MTSCTENATKQVRWGSVHVLTFRTGYNASAVPQSGGPPVGLVGRPIARLVSFLPSEDEEEEVTLERERPLSDAHPAMMPAETSLSFSCRRRRRNDMWLNPIERARMVMEEYALTMDDIAVICHDVQATLDSRAFSRFDEVAERAWTCAHPDTSPLSHGTFLGATRQKVLLY
ncbi:hypothetical protein PsorP6_006484 [Peronosclerospora sorghi]|uniref:Uncharacterized protein n=1 Tax=Peronosclerospora sorghi TaxID=230839 RepID=A0ACC0W7K7_9STRA|nr:hypothetical protein PsorP6_006484 [Peronosclerospora sorghi]